jgi:hypothetical protein
MAKTLELSEHYAGRGDGFVPVNFSLEREAAELLLRVAPGIKSRGRFISRLIYEHAAREEERRRLREHLAQVLHTHVVEGAPDA